MKFLFIILFIFILNPRYCSSQVSEQDKLDKMFIDKFIVDRSYESRFFKNDTIYFLGNKKSFKSNKFQVIYLSQEDVLEKLKQRETFNLILMGEYRLENNRINTSFFFLIASIKNERLKLNRLHDDDTNYYLYYDCNNNSFKVVWNRI